MKKFLLYVLLFAIMFSFSITFGSTSKAIEVSPNEDYTLNIISKKDEIINSILSKDVFEVEGNVIKNGVIKKINEAFDFSKASKFDIVEWLRKENVLTHKEEIELYCDLIIDGNFSNVTCLSEVTDTLREYRETNGENRVSKLLNKIFNTKVNRINKKIDSILARPFSSDHLLVC